ncbi:MAG: efflux RND transporter periplasmic adaptor subunit, partial [bacterium]
GVRTQAIHVDWHLFPEPVRQVDIEQVARRSITQRIQAPGQLAFAIESRIQAPFSATVLQVLVKNDQPVTAGDVLIRLDDASFQSAMKSLVRQRESIREMYDASRTQFAQIEKQVQQLEAAYPAPNPAPAELTEMRDQLEKIRRQADRLKADFQQTDESVRNYQKTIDRCVIKAPHDGVITHLNARAGDMVGGVAGAGMPNLPGMPGALGEAQNSGLVQVARTDRFIARVWVDESDVADVRTGQMAEMSLLDVKFGGKVSRVAAVGRRQMESIAFETEIEPELRPEELSKLRAGMSVMVDIEVRSRRDAMSIPVQAVVQRRARDVQGLGLNDVQLAKTRGVVLSNNAAAPAKAAEARDNRKKAVFQADPMRFLRVVYVLRQGKATALPVEIGLSDESYVEVISGLEKSDEVIVGPYHELDRLLDQTPVVARKNGPAPDADNPSIPPLNRPESMAGIRP